jgi:hypothetical protein
MRAYIANAIMAPDARQRCVAGKDCPAATLNKHGHKIAPKLTSNFISCPFEPCAEKRVCCENSPTCYEHLQTHCRDAHFASEAPRSQIEWHSNARAFEHHFGCADGLEAAKANLQLVLALPDIIVDDRDLYTKTCSGCNCMLGGFAFRECLKDDLACKDLICFGCARAKEPVITPTAAAGAVRLWRIR